MVHKRSIICDTNIIAYFFEGNKEAGKIISLSDVIISSVTFIEALSNKKIPVSNIKLVTADKIFFKVKEIEIIPFIK